MSRPLALAAALLASLSARADPPAVADGRVESDGSRLEVLGKPVPVGERIVLPEGWMRVEEQGVEDRAVGSFGVVAAGSTTTAPRPGADVLSSQAGEQSAAGLRPPAAPACRRERAAYLRELWRLSGIEFDEPDALLEGLEGDALGARTGFYWFALATDPFRPLAWSSDLRDRAEELARCVREAR
jgi:hypothetical protein